MIAKTGRSDGIIQAISWIREKAQLANKPAVISTSVSAAMPAITTAPPTSRPRSTMHSTRRRLGSRSSLRPGTNATTRSTRSKTSAPAGTWELEFDVPGKDKDGDFLTVSYPPGAARITVQVTSQNGSVGTVVAPGGNGNDTLERSPVGISSRAPTATDRGVIFISIRPPPGSKPGDKPSISSGTWKLTLKETRAPQRPSMRGSRTRKKTRIRRGAPIETRARRSPRLPRRATRSRSAPIRPVAAPI